MFLAAIAPISAQITPQQTAAIRAAKTARISVVVRNDGKPTERDNSAAPWSSPVAYESFLRDMISLAGLTQGGDLTIAVSVDGKARAVEYRDRFSGAPMYAYLAGSLKGTITFSPAGSPALVVKFDGKAPRPPEKITVGGGGDSGPTSSPAFSIGYDNFRLQSAGIMAAVYGPDLLLRAWEKHVIVGREIGELFRTERDPACLKPYVRLFENPKIRSAPPGSCTGDRERFVTLLQTLSINDQFVEAGLPFIQRALSDADPELRDCTLRGMRVQTAKRIVPQLIPFLDDPNPAVKSNARNVLAETRIPEALRAVEAADKAWQETLRQRRSQGQ